jgi:hypothetical protein
MVYVNPAQVLYVRAIPDERGVEARSIVQFPGETALLVEGSVATVASRLSP